MQTSVNFDGKSRSAAEEAALKLTKLTFSISLLSTTTRTWKRVKYKKKIHRNVSKNLDIIVE